MPDLMPNPLPQPPRGGVLREAFAGLDMLTVPYALAKVSRNRSDYQSHNPVVVLPGLGAGDRSTAPLRYFLSKNGFKVKGWGLGINNAGRGLISDLSELSDRWDVDRDRPHNGEGEVPALCDKVTDQVQALSEELGRPVHVIGWSLGGYLAREVARDLPEHVASVVTMGAPVLGGPKYSAVAPLFKARKVDLDWIEQGIAERFETPITQPITVIYSKSDGIVYWSAAMDNFSPNVTHIEVKTSHLGIGLNAGVWNHVLNALKRAEQSLLTD